MSAITGVFHLNKEPISVEESSNLLGKLQKYPADDVQTWDRGNIFLGCLSQWITPESINEKVPYYCSKSKLAITADAIIDNREELFERLQIEHLSRRNISDSQLILLSYQKWQEDSPKYLIGDFSFMIWDEKKKHLFGARDFSGTRTLYYFNNGNRFAFCTLIEPLLSLPYIKKELNEEWLAEYLSISGMFDSLDASNTPYKLIKQVPPSHSITINGGDIKISKYANIIPEEQLRLKSDDEYVEAFQDIFQSAVTSRLRTFRGVGAQLSGGLDSGAVMGFAANVMRKENKCLHSFSYIPPKDFVDFTPKYILPDERPYIKSTVKHVGGIEDHYLDFEGRDSYSEIDSFLNIMETPYKFFENSFWLKGMYERASKEGIGVLLNGDRGNFSVSWGSAYEYYATLLKKFNWIRLFKELDQFSKNVGGPRLRRLPSIARVGYPTIDRILRKDTTSIPPLLINKEFAKRTGILQKLNETRIYENTDIYEERRRHFEDLFYWNASNTLGTKLSLRYSLMKRDPTNDFRVIRFCLSIPEEQYVQNGLDRALIRRSTKNILPDKVRLNQKIYGVQGVDWIHRMAPKWDLFIKEARQMQLDSNIREFMDHNLIRKALLKAEEGPRTELATDPYLKLLMRSVIVHRFIKSFS